MKKIISISLVLFAGIVLLASCRKKDYYDDRNDVEVSVVFEITDSPFSIIKFNNDGTYAIIEHLESDSELWPIEGDQLQGRFYEGKESIVYNFDTDSNNQIYVVEVGLVTLDEAREALDYYVDEYYAVAGTNKVKMEFKRRVK